LILKFVYIKRKNEFFVFKEIKNRSWSTTS
jgi:hypothetical protein